VPHCATQLLACQSYCCAGLSFKSCEVPVESADEPAISINSRKERTMIDLNGKRALVTGGSRGIGAAIASALAENGADVAFTYQHSADRAAAVKESITSKGRRAVAIQADSADPEAITRSVSDAVSAL